MSKIEQIKPAPAGAEDVCAQHCPKCQFVQPPAAKCKNCGHVFPVEALPELSAGSASGLAPFDEELKIWLKANGWSLKRNLLSAETELRTPRGKSVINDDDLHEMRFRFTNKSGSPSTTDAIAGAVSLIASRHEYHPVRDYLDGLHWDGERRVDTWLIDFAGAEDTPLNRAIGRKFLCAAVRRARKPGCKFDQILLLEGKQGAGKSTLAKSLCHDSRWFSDQAKVGAEAKETIEQTRGAWVVEMPELDGLTKRDAGRVKSFVSTTHDRARAAYGRYAETVPRQFVLIGTTNDAAFLTDTTGNRRWWIVSVGRCDAKGLSKARDQLWAEADYLADDEPLWLESEELQQAAELIAERHIDHGPWFDHLAGIIPETGDLKIPVGDLWGAVGMPLTEISRMGVQQRSNLQRAMRGLGFEGDTKVLRENGQAVRCYVRGEASTAIWWRP